MFQHNSPLFQLPEFRPYNQAKHSFASGAIFQPFRLWQLLQRWRRGRQWFNDRLRLSKTIRVFKTLTPFVNWAPKQFSQLESLNKHALTGTLSQMLPCSVWSLSCHMYFFHLWGSLSLFMLPVAILMGWYAGANTDGKSLTASWFYRTDIFSRSQYVIPHKNIQSFSLPSPFGWPIPNWLIFRSISATVILIRNWDPLFTGKDG